MHHDLVRNNVNDNVTAQLLSEIDGMIFLNTIFVIGTTNALEAIDVALLRPGRLETIIKIELPDSTARSSIFGIHTKVLLHNGALNQDVDVNSIIRRTAGISGAHIARIVRLPIHAAMQRDILNRDEFDIIDDEADKLAVCNQDFIEALSEMNVQYFK